MNPVHQPGEGMGTESRRARAGDATMIQRPSKRSERGTALVEFAFTAVVTFVLFFGIVDFARALYSYHFISNAAREATRFASVRGALCSASASPCPAGAADIRNYVLQIAPLGIDQTQITVTPTWPAPVYPPVCGTTQGYPGCPVQVQVSYNFNFLFPVNFYKSAPVSFSASSFIMSSTSEMTISR